MKNITSDTVKRTTIRTSAYCHLAKEEDFIEVTDWSNGEGRDILGHSNHRQERLSLTHGEWQALCVAFNYIEED